MPGKPMSEIRTCGGWTRSISRAASASSATRTPAPCCSSTRRRRERWSASSSTSSRRTPLRALPRACPSCTAALPSCAPVAGAVSADRTSRTAGTGADLTVEGASPTGSATVKAAPLPAPALVTRTVPPCSSTNCLTMLSPKPSPPWRREAEESDCRKRSKTYGRKSSGMPWPLSRTVTSASPSARAPWTWRTSMRPLRGVNLIALDSRFQNTCRSRVESP